jgi:hypothetical protein
MAFGVMRCANRIQTLQSLYAFRGHQNMALCGWTLAQTWSCGSKASKSLILRPSFVQTVSTANVGAQSTKRTAVHEIVLTKGASSLVCLLVVVHRMHPLAQPQTSSCSDRPEWHIALFR